MPSALDGGYSGHTVRLMHTGGGYRLSLPAGFDSGWEAVQGVVNPFDDPLSFSNRQVVSSVQCL